MEILAITMLILAVILLLWMGWIDLKLWILPNELIAGLAMTAVAFHLLINWDYISLSNAIAGLVVGGGSLWVIRAVANKIYSMDTLGFGDIKLMAAGGLWLGAEGILMAMSVGALCGVLHAFFIVVRKKIIMGHWVSMNRMALPAGPGFIAGLIIIALYMYGDLLI